MVKKRPPSLKAAVTAMPGKGKANAALIALLSRSRKIPKSAAILSQGVADRNKALILIGLSALPAAAARLKAALTPFLPFFGILEL